ncbi:MAG: hypothetical protein H6Q06_223 [Acidobacteria bacterium]|nr:hypothetical protein [Acidobacteriota bacterium]
MNPHPLRDWILSPARLPIPPLSQQTCLAALRNSRQILAPCKRVATVSRHYGADARKSNCKCNKEVGACQIDRGRGGCAGRELRTQRATALSRGMVARAGTSVRGYRRGFRAPIVTPRRSRFCGCRSGPQRPGNPEGEGTRRRHFNIPIVPRVPRSRLGLERGGWQAAPRVRSTRARPRSCPAASGLPGEEAGASASVSWFEAQAGGRRLPGRVSD